MKKSVRLTALLVALFLLTAAFVACDDTDSGETGSGESSSTDRSDTVTDSGGEESEAEEVFPDIEQKSYNDTVYLQVAGGLPNYWVEKSTQSVVSEAIYGRQMKIRNHLGVEVYGSLADGNHEHYHEGFVRSQKQKDGAVDIFLTNAYMSVPMMIKQGLFRDLKNESGLNLDASYWNSSYMESIAVCDHYYLGYSDFNIPSTYVLAFNKDMIEQYADFMGETIYDIVLDYRWTIDKMISLANLVYIDKTGDGKTEDDTFGMTGYQWHSFTNFLQASNIQLVDQNEAGDYEVSVFTDMNKEKTVDLIEKLKGLAGSDSAWFRYRLETTPMIGLETGRALMSIVGTNDLEKYLDYDFRFGVLPYPMYDEAQKEVGYRSLNWSGYIVMPAYLENEEMVADTIELLAYWSEPVRVAFFQKMLGKQVSDTPQDSAMLDIVWDGICSDYGLTYSHLTGALDNNLYMMAILTNPNGAEQPASFIGGYTKSANTAISKFLYAMEKVDY